MRISIDKEIYLIRHGETDWNKLGLAQGSRNDIVLNKTGKEQAKKTGKYLKDYREQNKKFDMVLCSPMLRTKETAEIICNNINFDINKIEYYDELVEVDHGLLSNGKPFEELMKDKFYEDFMKLHENLDKIKDPIEHNILLNKYKLDDKINKKYEIETNEHLLKRCKKIMNIINKSKKKKILIISHGGTIIDGFIKLLFNINDIKVNKKFGDNCHITYIIKNKTDYTPRYIMLSNPNTLHLGLYN